MFDKMMKGAPFGIYALFYLLSVYAYIFIDDGGIATKVWYDYPAILIVSIFMAALLSALPTLLFWGICYGIKVVLK